MAAVVQPPYLYPNQQKRWKRQGEEDMHAFQKGQTLALHMSQV